MLGIAKGSRLPFFRLFLASSMLNAKVSKINRIAATMNGKKQRYDYFLIWGHGLPYQDQILQVIESDLALKIIHIQRFRPRDLPRFVNEIYSCDYAPREHLKSKTDYLMTLPINEVMIIYVLNTDVQEVMRGEGAYRHVECDRIKRIKDMIRRRFNPRVDGRQTEWHVVHASDNETHTSRLFLYVRFMEQSTANENASCSK